MIALPQAPSGKPIKPLGIVWYADEASYAKMQSLCADMHQSSFAEWHAAANQALQEAPEGAQPRMQVVVVPEHFEAWCKAARTAPNAPARQRYVHDLVEAAFTQALRAYKKRKKGA